MQVESPTTGVVEIRYERATIGFTLVVAPQAPNRVVGLQLVGTRRTDDNMDRVLAGIAALPGRTALSIAQLGDAGPVWLHEQHADTLMATGSSFKLYILPNSPAPWQQASDAGATSSRCCTKAFRGGC